jgi:hypothetical protein
MSEYLHSALAEAPSAPDPIQQALTDRFLTPRVAALDALFRELRARIDPALRATRDGKPGKPYPLGLCLEISEAVLEVLDRAEPADLSAQAAEGLAALLAFRAAGGTVRRAWGDLRGLYFQNALLVGGLYVDVSNDTVFVEKPPVEILPFAKAGFGPIVDHAHFARIAERYWGHRILSNHLLPELAPYLPLIHIDPQGRISLGPANRYMAGLTLAGEFAPSAQILAGPPMPPRAFATFGLVLAEGALRPAASPEQGRVAALAFCQAYRVEGRAGCADSYNRAMATAREVNRALARLVAMPGGEAADAARAA